MDWKNLVADKNLWLPAGCFTPGRTAGIDRIIIHHNAGDLTTEGCYRAWTGGREASAHYQVEEDGTIGQLVHDRDTAWHCVGQNYRSIGIEHANDAFGPWTVSEATLDAGAHLVAALCLYYGLGRPAWGANVFCHRDFRATACPGELGPGGSQHDAYMARAQAWYDAMAGGSPAPSAPAQKPAQPAQKPSRRQVAIDGKWGRETTLALQERYGLYADGIVSGQNASFKGISAGCLYGSFEWVLGGGSGSPTIKALQGTIGAAADGFVGPATWRALIAYGMARGSGAAYNDARLDDPSVTIEWLQRALNAGTL